MEIERQESTDVIDFSKIFMLTTVGYNQVIISYIERR